MLLTCPIEVHATPCLDEPPGTWVRRTSYFAASVHSSGLIGDGGGISPEQHRDLLNAILEAQQRRASDSVGGDGAHVGAVALACEHDRRSVLATAIVERSGDFYRLALAFDLEWVSTDWMIAQTVVITFE